MTLFFPDIVEFGDPVGLSIWMSGHYYEHRAFLQKALASNYKVPDVDLYSFDPQDTETQRGWLEGHGLVHDSLRQLTGISGPDYSEVDFTKERQFTEWLQYHAQEHQALRQFFGML
jgi:hypothetical protein